jgi:putative solute:sodium symporter small subunit
MRRMSKDAQRVFWSRTKRLTLLLLAAWLTVSLLVPWFARDLESAHVFGFPVSYWFAAEGALLFFVAIIVAYVVLMDRLEARFLAAGPDATDEPGS